MRETVKHTITDERTNRSYRHIKHSSGLDIFLAPLDGFYTTCAMFGAKYGSIHNCFKTSDDDRMITVPDGIAHYLEHKLFENGDSNVFELFAETGAYDNAFTGFENTVYYFNCSENYDKSLRILLNFVQKPYFTPENVEKERGIIAQEIKMSLDIPSRRCFYELLRAMYHYHPVNIDIAGSEESIAKITPELLYKCYDTFYDLNNMALSVAGNLDEDEVLAICDECLRPCEDKKLEVSFPDEPYEVAKKKVVTEFGVGVPIFSIGFKCRPVSDELALKNEVSTDMMLSLLAGRMSPLYKELSERKLVNGDIGKQVFDIKGVSSCIFSGESRDPEAVAECVIKHIEAAKKNGFDREQFELIRKSEYGSSVNQLATSEGYADALLMCHFNDIGLFDEERLIADMTYEDMLTALNRIDTDNYSLSIIV